VDIYLSFRVEDTVRKGFSPGSDKHIRGAIPGKGVAATNDLKGENSFIEEGGCYANIQFCLGRRVMLEKCNLEGDIYIVKEERCLLNKWRQKGASSHYGEKKQRKYRYKLGSMRANGFTKKRGNKSAQFLTEKRKIKEASHQEEGSHPKEKVYCGKNPSEECLFAG